MPLSCDCTQVDQAVNHETKQQAADHIQHMVLMHQQYRGTNQNRPQNETTPYPARGRIVEDGCNQQYCILRKLSGGRSHATRDTLAPSVHVNVGNPVAIDLPAALADGVGFPALFRISCILQV